MAHDKNNYWEAMAYDMGETSVKWKRDSDGEPLAKTYANLEVLSGMSGSVPLEADMDDHWTNTFEPWLDKVEAFDGIKKRDINNIVAKLCSCDASEGEIQAALFDVMGDVKRIKRRLGIVD